MSVYTYVYLGPYAEVSTKITLERIKRCDKGIHRPSSADKECPWTDDSKPTGFCSVCGLNSYDWLREEWVPEVNCDLIGETNEALRPLAQVDEEERRTWRLVPNSTRDGGPERMTEWEARCALGLTVDLDNVAVAKEKEWLRFTYGPELSRLEKLFGNLDVKWGMIIYGM